MLKSSGKLPPAPREGYFLGLDLLLCKVTLSYKELSIEWRNAFEYSASAAIVTTCVTRAENCCFKTRRWP